MRKADSRIALPFYDDDYASMDGIFRKLKVTILWLNTLLISVIGYAVYFSQFDANNLEAINWLIEVCTRCSVRFSDLQSYDGKSGQVYVAVAVLLLLSSVISYLSLFFAYCLAWLQADTYAEMEKGAVGGFALSIIVLCLVLWVLIFLDLNISDTQYPGSTVALTGLYFPPLAGMSVQLISLTLMQQSVFLIKLIKQKVLN